MENLNIPIYRALKLDTKDEYIDGYLFKIWEKYYIQWGTTNGVPNQIEIDPSTLSINFPDMKDSEDNPIFASLRSDGKGGDLLEIISNESVAEVTRGRGRNQYLSSIKSDITVTPFIYFCNKSKQITLSKCDFNWYGNGFTNRIKSFSGDARHFDNYKSIKVIGIQK